MYLLLFDVLLSIALGSTSTGFIQGKVVDALESETVIEIGVEELKSGPPKPRLPKDYGQRLAKILQENQKSLVNCLPDGEAAHRFQIDWKIAGTGKTSAIRVSYQPRDMPLNPDRANPAMNSESVGRLEDCLSEVLSSLQAPEHPLPKSASVKLPLSLTREEI